MTEEPTATFMAKSIYGALTDRPLVQLGWDVMSSKVVAPEEARAIAVSIFQAAEAAETDAFMVQWLRGRIGMGMEQVVAVLQEFRTWRHARHGSLEQKDGEL